MKINKQIKIKTENIQVTQRDYHTWTLTINSKPWRRQCETTSLPFLRNQGLGKSMNRWLKSKVD